MSFSIPSFNLPVAVFRWPFVYADGPSFTVMGNLSPGPLRVTLFDGTPGSSYPQMDIVSLLRVPAFTDIRPLSLTNQPDALEIPAGSLRMYDPQDLEDQGKGFSNEHRLLTIQKSGVDLVAGASPFWQFPIP